MRRGAFNILAGASAVLCLAVLALWARSYWVSDVWVWVGYPLGGKAPEHRASLLSHSGQFSLNWQRTSLDPGGRYTSRLLHEARRPPVEFWRTPVAGIVPAFLNRIGFALFDTHVHAPAWSVALAFGLVAVFCSRPRWGPLLRRTRIGVCPTCGYDLRATPERCPECGTVPEPLPAR